jgi:hypothetical protein
LGEKVLGSLQVQRGSWGGVVHEELVLTSERVAVLRQWEENKSAAAGATNIIHGVIGLALDWSSTESSKKEMQKRYRHAGTIEKLLEAHKNNFDIPNSEIVEVVQKVSSRNWLRLSKITIKTGMKRYKWNYGKPIPKNEDAKLEKEYEDLLRQAFGNKVSVKK